MKIRAAVHFAWMLFCIAWGLYQFDMLYNIPHATQGEVNRAIFVGLTPFAIGRAIMREMAFQDDE